MNNFFKTDLNRLKTTVFYSIIFIFIASLSIRFNSLDFDLWARLIAGYFVLDTGNVALNDVVSYTNTHVWYDPEWLSSAFIYLIQSKFGVAGLTYLKIFLLFFLFVLLSITIKKRCKKENPKNIGYYLILVLITLQSGLISTTFRCQFVTFILMVFWIFLLEEIKNGKNKYLFLLPFLMLFWLNTHGGALSGVGILFLYGVGEFLNKNEYKKYFIALFFVCLVFLINPWGMDFIPFILKSSYLDRSWIAEWQSPFQYAYHFNNIYKTLLFFSFICYIYKIFHFKISYSNLNKTKFLILLTLAFLSVKYLKHIGLFIVVYSIYMYEDYYFFYNNFMGKIKTFLKLDDKKTKILSKIKNIFVYSVVFIYSAVVLVTIPVNLSFYTSYITTYPVFAVEFLKINNIKGNVFAPFYYGSYIAYKSYPDLKIYMDGRQEQVYDMETFDNNMFFLRGLSEANYWDDFFEKNETDIFLLEKNIAADKFLSENKKYTLIYSDFKFNIYVKNSLKKFNYKKPKTNEKYYISTIFNTHFQQNKDKKP